MTGMQILQALENPAQEYLEECEKTARPHYIRWIAAAACLCVLLAVGVPLYRQYGYFPGASTPATTVAGGPVQSDAAGGSWNGMPDRVLAQAPTVVGTGFTQEEIDYELNKWKFFYDETQGVSWEDAEVAAKGYSHVSLTETGNEVRLDFYDLPILYNGRIGAMLTIYRIDTGEVSSQISYGGTGWDSLNRVLDEHPGEDLLMVYVGHFLEAILTQEGEIIDFRGEPEGNPPPETPLEARFDADMDWYALLYSPDCVLNGTAVYLQAQPMTHHVEATLPEISEDELFEQSMLIVRGTVQDGGSSLRVRSADGQTHNYTDYTVTVEEVLRGENPGADVTVRINGGTVGGIRETWNPSPRPEAGKEYLLFLYRPGMGGLNTVGDHWYIVGAISGFFEEVSDGLWRARDGRELTAEQIRDRADDYPVDEDYFRKEFIENQKRNLANGQITQAEYDEAIRNMDVYAEIIG